VIRLVNRFGWRWKASFPWCPTATDPRSSGLTAQALETAYGSRAAPPDLGDRGRMFAARCRLGAAGGAGGLATALAELPVTVTLILNAIRSRGREAGL
jgi:hypothetical protein